MTYWTARHRPPAAAGQVRSRFICSALNLFVRVPTTSAACVRARYRENGVSRREPDRIEKHVFTRNRFVWLCNNSSAFRKSHLTRWRTTLVFLLWGAECELIVFFFVFAPPDCSNVLAIIMKCFFFFINFLNFYGFNPYKSFWNRNETFY